MTQAQPQAVRPESGAALTLPAPIGAARVGFLISKGADADIAALDLEMVKMKLAEPDEGAGWTAEQCEDAEVEYKRYLTLCRKFPAPAHSVVPNKIMDTMWHYHILDTRAYCRDSDKVFGGYFHHFPYFGMRGDEDERDLIGAFGETKRRYEKAFGEPMDRTEMQKCWHECKGSCWHECKNVSADEDIARAA